MKTFLIQTVDGQVAHDFSFHLVEAIKYQNWYHNEKLYDYELHDSIENAEKASRFESKFYPLIYKLSIKNYIPVGSVEFVLEFYEKYHSIKNIKPINIPKELMDKKFLKRYVYLERKNRIGYIIEPVFIKSIDKIKGFTDIVKNNNTLIEDGNYLVSEIINIDSEWRGFVFNNKLLDLRCYSGKFDVFPDVELVKEMVADYKSSPRSYTIDVGVNNDQGTFLIECHQFFSCGLYGFADYRVLPQMFVSCHKEIISY